MFIFFFQRKLQPFWDTLYLALFTIFTVDSTKKNLIQFLYFLHLFTVYFLKTLMLFREKKSYIPCSKKKKDTTSLQNHLDVTEAVKSEHIFGSHSLMFTGSLLVSHTTYQYCDQCLFVREMRRNNTYKKRNIRQVNKYVSQRGRRGRRNRKEYLNEKNCFFFKVTVDMKDGVLVTVF